MADKRWRLRLYNYNSTTLSTGNVYFQTTALQSPITVNGPIVRAADGRTEAQPWNVDVVDDGSSFTRMLADSSGRMIALGRVASVERSVNGSSFAYHGAGRVADVFLTTNPGVYRLVVEDERRVERQSIVFFSTNTTRLYPAGPHRNFGAFAAPPKCTLTVQYQSTVPLTGNCKLLVFNALPNNALTQGSLNAIQQDVVSLPSVVGTSSAGYGNFTYSRIRVGNTDYPILSFGVATFLSANTVHARPTADWLGTLAQNVSNPGAQMFVWVRDASSGLTVGQRYSSAFLHQFTAPPSPGAPLHIGTSSGMSPLTAAKQVYAGTYSRGSGEKVRYSTAAFDALAKNDFPTVLYRVTQQSNMADWLEQNIYQPFLICPGVDAQGRVAPFSLRPLNSTTGITKVLNGANLREPYPTWDHPLRQTVTVANVVLQNLGVTSPQFPTVPSSTGGLVIFPRAPHGSQQGGDGLYSFQSSAQITHDRVGQLGRYTINLSMNGLFGISRANPGNGAVPINFPTRDAAGSGVADYLAWYAHGLFPRFGDGPVFGQLQGLSTAESVHAGDWVTLTVPQYPNAAIPGRGGSRYVQILSRNDTPLGPEFQYLDGGPQVAPPTAPTVVLSTSTSDPTHSVVATIGSVPSGSTFQLQYALSGSQPSSASGLWQPVRPLSTGSKWRVGRLPANTKIWTRAKTVKNGTLASPWTYSTGKTTGKLLAPSGLASSGVGPTSFTLDWTPGEADAATDVHVDPSTSASFTSTNRIARLLQPLVGRYTVTNTTRGHKYLAGVRYADYYGGFSSRAAIAVTTSTVSLPRAPTPLGVAILSGLL